MADALHHLVKDLFMDVQARTGTAALPMVKEDGARGSGDGLVDLRIGEDDGRGFSAELERHLLQISGGGVDNQLAHFG